MSYVEAALKKREEIDAANALMSDEQALQNKGAYRSWAMLVKYAVEVGQGYRFRHGDRLYKVLQPTFTFVDTWEPGSAGSESLFAVIDESHAGTLDDPIPYEGNMELFEGLYYTQGSVVYRCTRSTGIPVYASLSELVGLYVEVVDAEDKTYSGLLEDEE